MKWIASLFAFREANHSSVVTAMKKIESPKAQAPRPYLAPAKVLTFAEWLAKYERAS